MAKWSCYGLVRGSKFLGEFEADTKEAAIKLAEESDECYVSLCHQCANECDDPDIYEVHAEPAE